MNDVKSYSPPFPLDQPIVGGVVAEVIQTNASSLVVGDMVTGRLPWQEYMIASQADLRKIDPALAPPSYYLGILGMPGLTAYIGLVHIGKPRAGETVVVSGAAGAVGIVVGQIAKIQGCRVVGIAGSDEKCELLERAFGFDATINYRTATDLKAAVGAACPDGVDIYFDNVGGEISDAVISHINFFGRIPLCGQIALYNATEKMMGPRLGLILLTRSVLLQGFIVFNYEHLYPEAFKALSTWVAEGRLKFTETIVTGFEQLPNALIGLFKSENTGKMIVKAS
jgi:NADPH-dependent curcumin reductase CurA